MKLTDSQWQEVASRYEAGESSTLLGKEFGVHYLTVLNNMRRLGMTVRTHFHGDGPVLTAEVKARMAELAAKGMSGREIARQLGINYTLVYRNHEFKRHKKEKAIKLGKKDRSALTELLETLRKFRATERGAMQSQTLDPQIKALKGLLS
jgi:DNA invertase Pin-like site-specific DNA recombinase